MSRAFSVCAEKLVMSVLSDLDSPRSLMVKILIDHGEWDQVARLKLDPAHYNTADTYYRAAAATEFLRKCKDIDPDDPEAFDFEEVDYSEMVKPSKGDEIRRSAAVAGFWQSEKTCHQTNLRVMPYLLNGPFEDPSELHLQDFLAGVKAWMTRTLGPLPNDLEGRFGPGATFGDRGTKTTVPHKMSSRPTVTSDARCLLSFLEQTAWIRNLCAELPNHSDPETIRGNRFTTVPKDATKDRGICIEPSINIFLQLAVGGVLRERLRRVGIDLEEGQPIHRRVACEASKTGRYATIDLSSASDTVSRKLVELLLPPDWYSLLATLRSSYTYIDKNVAALSQLIGNEACEGMAYDGKWVYLEKFSSMGNGFTFELETLIFLSLAVQTAKSLGVSAIPGVDIYVYGDDIIVPVEVAEQLISVLRWCGFSTNPRKTFITGPFRESCGGDYFNGVDVRPFYMKEFPHDPATWIVVANGIRRMASTDSGASFDRLPLRRSWFCALDNIPDHVRRLRGPVLLGDTLIHDNPEKWSAWWKGQVRYFKIWQPIQRHIQLEKWSAGVQLASAVYGVPPKGPILRGPVSGYRFGCIALSIIDERHVPGGTGRFKRMFKRLCDLLGTDG